MSGTDTMELLAQRHCRQLGPQDEALVADLASGLLAQVPGWEMDGEAQGIERTFVFDNYYQTVSFVNAVAWIAHREDHHPDIEFGYKRCRVHYATHSVGGLSENDFICAARINVLLEA
jgi:4a-hydroxytetrahydrobiopterin dehydratase